MNKIRNEMWMWRFWVSNVEMGNPWLKIWTEPRKTIRGIVHTNPKRAFILLSTIYGLPIAFNFAQNISLETAIPFWAILIASLILCPFIGMIGISIGAWI